MAFDETAPFFCIDDSDNALIVIMDRGLLGDFPKNDGKDAAYIASVIDPHHPNHWLLTCHLVGYTVRNVANPYMIFGFLKTKFSLENVEDFFEKISKFFGDEKPPHLDFIEPDRN